MTQQHTPGPWSFDPTNREGSSGLIRCTFGQDNGGNGIVIARNVSSDNAPIITNAPELLKALETLLRVKTNSQQYSMGAHCNAEDKARAAIVKAGGPA